jgi:hypothetical protein
MRLRTPFPIRWSRCRVAETGPVSVGQTAFA